MIRKISLTFLIGLLLSGCGSGNSRSGYFASPPTDEILLGNLDRTDLLQAPHNDWFEKRYQNYKPKKDAMLTIQENLDAVDSIQIYVGTWCKDSRKQIPRLLKIIDQTSFDANRIKMTGLGWGPAAADHRGKALAVPTIIFYKEGKELNRIVERPRQRLEKDIARFVSEAP